MEFFSHPEKLLYGHLSETYEYGKNQISSENNEIYRIIAYSHDIGKYTTYFQDHLFGRKESNLSEHSYISALFGSYTALKKDFSPVDVLIVYNVINNHHGNIKNIDFKDKTSNKEKIEKQISDLRKNKEYIIKSISKINFENEFVDFTENFSYDIYIEKINPYIYGLKKRKNIDNYFKHQELYSALVYSDKLSASKLYENKLSELQNDKIFEEYNNLFSGKSKKNINIIRNDIYNEIQKNCDYIEKNDKIITITAPTGTGKTYSGFLAALKIKEKFNKKKIIYVLPYTSIIEQNYDKIKKILISNKNFEKDESQYIIKHHYLSKKEYIDDKERYTNSQSEILFESWNSDIVVTTYVQLLETIIGNKNRYLKKYNQIKESVIILDEIQTVDIKYYELIENVIEKFSEKYNVPFLIMTATKPVIFKKYKELLINNENFFQKLNRIKLDINLEEMNTEKFVNEINEKKKDKSVLIICNTVKESLEVYNKIKDDKSYYLSTNILPVDRKRKINCIEEKLRNDEKITVVSTQLVEAGVDLDFDIVFRDIAQLDSIIQSAGRCNRNSYKNIGTVYIRRVIDENGKPFSSYIYSTTSLGITLKLFENKKIIEEKNFKEIIEKYYKILKNNSSYEESEQIFASMEKLNFKDDSNYSINDFSLITEKEPKIDVYFIVDDKSEKIYYEYSEITKIKDYNEKRNRFLNIKSDLSNYTLAVSQKYFNILKIATGKDFFPHLNRIESEQYYDDEVGIKKEVIQNNYEIF